MARVIGRILLGIAIFYGLLFLAGSVYRPINKGPYRQRVRGGAFVRDSFRTIGHEQGGKGITTQADPAKWAQHDIGSVSAYKLFGDADEQQENWVNAVREYNPNFIAIGFDTPNTIYLDDNGLNVYDWYEARFTALDGISGRWWIEDTNTPPDSCVMSYNHNVIMADLTIAEVRDSLVAVISRFVKNSTNYLPGTGLIFDTWEWRYFNPSLGGVVSPNPSHRPDLNGDNVCNLTDSALYKAGRMAFANELHDALGGWFLIGGNSTDSMVDDEMSAVLDFFWLEDIHKTRWTTIYNNDIKNLFNPLYTGFADNYGGNGGNRNIWEAYSNLRQGSATGPFIIWDADAHFQYFMVLSMLTDFVYLYMPEPNIQLQNMAEGNIRRYYYPGDHRFVDMNLTHGGEVQWFTNASSEDSTILYREFSDGSVLVTIENDIDGAPKGWVTNPPITYWAQYGRQSVNVYHGSFPAPGYKTTRGGTYYERNHFPGGDIKTIIVSSDTSTTRAGSGTLWPSSRDRAIEDCRWSQMISNSFGGQDSTTHVTYTSGVFPYLISYAYQNDNGTGVNDWPLKITWGPAYQSVLWYPLEWTKEYHITSAHLRFRQYSANTNNGAGDTLWCHFMTLAPDTLWPDQMAGGAFTYEADPTWTELRDGISGNWGPGGSYYWLSQRGPNHYNKAKRGIKSFIAYPLGQLSWYSFDITEAVRMVSYGSHNAGMILSYRDAALSPASWRAVGPEGWYSSSVGDSDPFLIINAARRDTIGP